MPRVKPTKHRRIIKLSDLIQLSENIEPSLSIKPLHTVSESTPEEHSIYEHNELSDSNPTEAVKFLMPWDDPQQANFLKSIVPITTNDFHKLFVERTKEQCENEGQNAVREMKTIMIKSRNLASHI